MKQITMLLLLGLSFSAQAETRTFDYIDDVRFFLTDKKCPDKYTNDDDLRQAVAIHTPDARYISGCYAETGGMVEIHLEDVATNKYDFVFPSSFFTGPKHEQQE